MWSALAGGSALGAAAALAWGARGRSSQLFGPSVWRGPADRPAVALTFDDGPSESTPRLLELLDRFQARATFFQCGAHARRLPRISRAVIEAGHEIGNHGDSHARLWLRSPAFVLEELGGAQAAIAEACGAAPRLFRAPYGVRWFGLREAQRRLGLLGVMWTAIGCDWKLPAEAVTRRLLGGVANGAILCLHDGRGPARNPDIGATLEAVRRLAPELQQRGFALVTVSELLRLPGGNATATGS